MIRVDRARTPAAEKAIEALANCGRDRLTERERAEWFFLNRKPRKPNLGKRPKKKPTFAAYKSDAVKEALNSVFGSKCAYCESRYDQLAPMDVEHYRPKNGYLDGKGKLVPPGYYWLAADWENLFPSCIDCNRERSQIRVASGGNRIKAKTGKTNKFPLARGSRRAKRPNQHLREQPLLLNPCCDDPQNHLRFTDEGMVLPSLGPREAQVPKGEATIEVCGLDRDNLVRERRALARRLQEAMERGCSTMRNVRKYPDDAELREQLARAEAALASFAELDQPYVAMVTELTDTFSRVSRTAEAYVRAVSELDANPADPARVAGVRAPAERLRELLRPGEPQARLARAVVGWLEVPLPPGA